MGSTERAECPCVIRPHFARDSLPFEVPHTLDPLALSQTREPRNGARQSQTFSWWHWRKWWWFCCGPAKGPFQHRGLFDIMDKKNRRQNRGRAGRDACRAIGNGQFERCDWLPVGWRRHKRWGRSLGAWHRIPGGIHCRRGGRQRPVGSGCSQNCSVS